MSFIRHILINIALVLALIPSPFSKAQQGSKDSDVQDLIAELYTHPWLGPENSCSPMCWNFQFTQPMLKILKRGRQAQTALIEKLHDSAIKDQVIILLGGIGDEQAVSPR